MSIDEHNVLHLYKDDVTKTLRASHNLTNLTTDNLKSSDTELQKLSYRASLRTEKGSIHFAFINDEQRQKWINQISNFLKPNVEESSEELTSFLVENILKLPEDRKRLSLMLMSGFVREMEESNSLWSIIPSEVIPVLHSFYFEPFEAVWSAQHKGGDVKISEEGTKVNVTGWRQACRGRDQIENGVIVEWSVNCYVHNGMCLGVISSRCNDFNDVAYGSLEDAWGIDDCPNMWYKGNAIRHNYIEMDDEEGWTKPRIYHSNASQTIKVRVDYKTHSFATLTYFFDDKVAKPSNQEYTMKLRDLDNGEFWYMLIDFWNTGWCKIVDYAVE